MGASGHLLGSPVFNTKPQSSQSFTKETLGGFFYFKFVFGRVLCPLCLCVELTRGHRPQPPDNDCGHRRLRRHGQPAAARTPFSKIVRLASRLIARSGWFINPNTRPSGVVMPAMPSDEPSGFFWPG
jgi:hypothetical protein